MSDNLSPEDRRKTMKAVKEKGTKPERQIWASLAGKGIRGWRKNATDIFGKPDIVFDNQKVAIFIDGCFWHRCPICQRKLPRTNKDYWERKINRNVELAEQYRQELENSGWRVFRIWEHEVKKRELRMNKLEKIFEEVAQREGNDKI